ncbi:MAG: sensor histidine kinase, partial [Oscillospiraceae bacterium]
RDREDPRAAPFSSVDLSHLLTCAAASFEPVFFESGRQLCAEIAPGCRIIGDAGTLSELFGILLDNARKYSAPGSTASIRLERDRSDGFCLTVENDGSTIPPEELPHIFERFYRGTSSRGEVSGSGLGLSIAEEIVKRHGGKIWAASTRGHTAFYVRLLQAG